MVSTFPLGMEWIVAIQVTVSPIGNWPEASFTIGVCDGAVHCLMLACWPHCKCCMLTSVLSLKKKLFFVQLLLLAASRSTCAS